MRVVFFGTPEFAVPSLRALLGEGFDVLAAVTQPDRPQGRSRSQVVPPPVKVEAEAEAIPVLQPERPTDRDFLDRLRELAPDVGVVVAYGHILKPELLRLPPRGMVNVHPSLLPELRGAAPVEWAILNGVAKTGVSIMQLDEGLDSGPVLLQIAHTIEPDEPGERVARLIRGLDPKPGAWTELAERELKLFDVQVSDRRGPPGEVLAADGRLLIATGSGAVAVAEVQPAGKARMPVADWVRGRGVTAGQRF